MQIPDISVISTWPPPNYINPETRGPAAIIVVSILLFLVTVLLAVRVYTRVVISRGFGLDDILILLAFVPTAAFASLSFVAQEKFGWGIHAWDVPIDEFTPALQASLASQLLFDVSTTLTKLSILALIWRVVSVQEGSHKYVVLIVAITVAVDGLAFFFVTLFQCSPLEAYWELSVTPQMCLNEQKHLLAAGCINTITDFLLVLLPIPYIWQLQLPKKQQMIVASLFAGGLFATGTGAARTFVTFQFFDSADADPTWNATPILLLSALELFISIICASIPATKPFFARYLPILIGPPAAWLPRSTGRTRGTASAHTGVAQESTSGCWPVTIDRDSIFSSRAKSINITSTSSLPLVMQMRSPPPMRRMPAAMSPQRTQFTTRPLSLKRPHNLNARHVAWPLSPSAGSMRSASTEGTSILDYASLTPTPAPTKVNPLTLNPLNLNKPLPSVRLHSTLQSVTTPEEGLDREENDEREIMSATMMSVYKVVPHADEPISVRETRERDLEK